MNLTFQMPADRTPTSVYSNRPAVVSGQWRVPTMSLRGPMSAGAGFWQPWRFKNVAYPGVTSGNYPVARFLGYATPNMVTLDNGQAAQCGRGIYG